MKPHLFLSLVLFLLLLASTSLVLVAGGIIRAPLGCIGLNTQDTSPWLSVVRGPGYQRGSLYQYWLTQSFVYESNIEAHVTETSHYKLPRGVKPVNGLVLGWVTQDLMVRVLLLDARNCLYDYYLPRLQPDGPLLYHTYCFDDPALPLWSKIVSDNNADMSAVKFLYLVSSTHLAIVSLSDIRPVYLAKLPASTLDKPYVVDVTYRFSGGAGDELFVIRGSRSPGQPSEMLNFFIEKGPVPRFGHVTFLQGESDTMFLNDDSTQLYWTQLVPDWNSTQGSTRGLLYDYSLQAPRFFRFAEHNFTANTRWGAHAFGWKQRQGQESMMITASNKTLGQPGFTIYAVYVNPSLPSLALVDALHVQDTRLPMLGQGTHFDQFPSPVDMSVMMASYDAQGFACLQPFIHCPTGHENDCFY